MNVGGEVPGNVIRFKIPNSRKRSVKTFAKGADVYVFRRRMPVPYDIFYSYVWAWGMAVMWGAQLSTLSFTGMAWGAAPYQTKLLTYQA